MRVIVWVWIAATRWKKVLARTATTSKPKRRKFFQLLRSRPKSKKLHLP